VVATADDVAYLVVEDSVVSVFFVAVVVVVVAAAVAQSVVVRFVVAPYAVVVGPAAVAAFAADFEDFDWTYSKRWMSTLKYYHSNYSALSAVPYSFADCFGCCCYSTIPHKC
jgi:hypothetical protein